MKTNSKRFYEIDLVRDIAILILPLVHIIEFLGPVYGYANVLSDKTVNILSPISNFFTLFAAPIFMICMGMNMAFTKKNNPSDFIKRGISLLILEIILNIIRYVIPGLISYLIASPVNKKIVLDIIIYSQLNSDILAFAGLSFILFGLFKKLNIKPFSILIISLILSVLSEIIVINYTQILNNILSNNLINLLGNITWLGPDSTFPLFEWLIFPSIGYLFALQLNNVTSTKDESDDNTLWNSTLFVSIIILTGIIICLKLSNQDVFKIINASLNDNYMSLICTLSELSISFIVMSIFVKIYKILKLENNIKVLDHISKLSINITYYYIIQWVIIGNIMFITCGLNLWNKKILNLPITIIICLIIMIISSYGSNKLRKIKENKKEIKHS